MFQFRAFPPYTYLIQYTVTEYCSAVFPHSEISGLSRICRSPKLIAACHVLLRLLMPRHSPCALISLTFIDGLSTLVLLNYAGFNRSSFLTKLYLPLIFKSSTMLFCRCFSFCQAAPSVALLLFSSVQFSRCISRIPGSTLKIEQYKNQTV